MSDDATSKQERRLQMLEQMISKGSTDPFHHYARAMELRSLGRLEDALTAYGDVKTRFPKYVPVYLMAGQVCMELQRNDEARQWLTDGIACAEAEQDHHALSELQAALETL